MGTSTIGQTNGAAPTSTELCPGGEEGADPFPIDRVDAVVFSIGNACRRLISGVRAGARSTARSRHRRLAWRWAPHVTGEDHSPRYLVADSLDAEKGSYTIRAGAGVRPVSVTSPE